ncbi:MAG: cytochrome C [Rhodobacteraceae bacterium]|nr:cytochrome C [Paracoccaceae bacterium]
MLPLLALLVALPVRATDVAPDSAGDTRAGEAAFRTCVACHALTRPDGQVIPRGGTTGPDLYGIIGRPAGGLPGYGYSAGLQALNAAGQVWDVTSLAAFIASPNGFLADRLGPGHLSKMPVGRRQGADAIAAWLAQVR